MGIKIDSLSGAMSGTITPFDGVNTYIGFGNSSASVDDIQTDLQGTSTQRIAIDPGYPKRDPDGLGENNKIRYRCTIGENDCLFDIQEIGIFNASVGGEMLFRELEPLGNKGTVTWVFEKDIILNEGV